MKIAIFSDSRLAEDKAAMVTSSMIHAKMGLGLLIFVAIPLPGTGAWTGSLAASVLRLPFWPSLLSIAGGVIIAGILVSGAGLGVLSLF